MSLRRKLAIATWSAPREGNIYGKITLDMTEAQAYLAHVRERSGTKVTVTHLVGKAAAVALTQAPGLNGRVVFNRYIPFDTVDLAFLVAVEGGGDLAKAKVERVDERPLVEVAEELNGLGLRLKAGKDETFEKNKGVLRLMPRFMLGWFLSFVGFLASGLGVQIKALGIERFPFGSAIITSVGMLGIDEGYAPPTPFARVPLYLAVGAIKAQPAVIDGELVIRDQMVVTATVDHRFVDGFQLGTMANRFRDLMENPWQLDESSAAERGEKVVSDTEGPGVEAAPALTS